MEQHLNWIYWMSVWCNGRVGAVKEGHKILCCAVIEIFLACIVSTVSPCHFFFGGPLKKCQPTITVHRTPSISARMRRFESAVGLNILACLSGVHYERSGMTSLFVFVEYCRDEHCRAQNRRRIDSFSPASQLILRQWKICPRHERCWLLYAKNGEKRREVMVGLR